MLANNMASAGISFAGTILLTAIWGLENIGALGIMVSITTMISPLIQFRLDLAFERVSKDQRPLLVSLVHVWAIIVAGIFLLGSYALSLIANTGFGATTIVIALNIVLVNFCNIIWAQKVSERALRSAFILQAGRALLSVILPAAVSLVSSEQLAFLLAFSAGQAVAFIYLPKIEFYGRRSIVDAINLVREKCPDLLLQNTIPVLINLASVYLAPILTALIFGDAAAGVMYLMLRLLISPAQLVADPVRRATYVRFPNAEMVRSEDLRRMFYISMSAAGFCLVLYICASIVPSNIMSFAPAQVVAHWSNFALCAIWAILIVCNSSVSALIPVMRIAGLQSVFELSGLFFRCASIAIGLIGFEFEFSLSVFLIVTILLNLLLTGAVLALSSVRLRSLHPSQIT